MTEQIILMLKQARRALDELLMVEIIDDWQFDKELEVWFLHIAISIEYKCIFFSQCSRWYVVVEKSYPKGKIKVYPDVEESLQYTLYHQANNFKVETNGLWRKGALCLERNTISAFQQEPNSIDERLLYHAKRAVEWLEAAAQGRLVSEHEPFELPEFTLASVREYQFAFSEDMVTYMQWESTECRYGIAELDIYKSSPLIIYVKKFYSLNQTVEHYTEWGTYLSRKTISEKVIAPWILLKDVPVVNYWQAPETMGDLIDACNKQNLDLYSILEQVLSKIRDGNRHLMLIGFPIPRTFGNEKEFVFWQALRLPAVSYGKKYANGFRANQQGWWLRDKLMVLKRNLKLEWLRSENWNQREIIHRGKIDNQLQRQSILILGAGCIGSTIAEMLVRAGIYNLTIADFDIMEVGNLSRHTLNMKEIGNIKEVALCDHLNALNPHARVKVIDKKLSLNDEVKPNIDLNKYKVIIDCTGADEVLEVFENISLNRKTVFATVSVGLGAKHLYLAVIKNKTFELTSFYEMIEPFIQNDREVFEDYDLPRDGTGCWHPTFPGRSDDIWLAAATSVKIIENYFTKQSEKLLSCVYEQKFRDGFFEGYVAVNKDE